MLICVTSQLQFIRGNLVFRGPLLLSEWVAEGDTSNPHDFSMQVEVAQIDVNRPNFATHLS